MSCPGGQRTAVFNISTGEPFPDCGCFDPVLIPAEVALAAVPKARLISLGERILDPAIVSSIRSAALATRRAAFARELDSIDVVIAQKQTVLDRLAAALEPFIREKKRLMDIGKEMGLHTETQIYQSAPDLWNEILPLKMEIEGGKGAKLSVVYGEIQAAENERQLVQNMVNQIDNGTIDVSMFVDVIDSIWAGMMFVLQALEVVQNHQCKDQSMLDPETCKCSRCPPDKTICKPPKQEFLLPRIPGVRMADELNYCTNACCGGQKNLWKATFAGGSCECECPRQNSEWYPEGRFPDIIGPSWYPEGIIQSLFACDTPKSTQGACEDGRICAPSNPPDRPNTPPPGWTSKYEWDQTRCEWKCKSNLCTGNKIPSLNPLDNCKCRCKEEGDRPPCNRPDVWVETRDDEAICGCYVGCCQFSAGSPPCSAYENCPPEVNDAQEQWERDQQDGVDYVHGINSSWIGGQISCNAAESLCNSYSNPVGISNWTRLVGAACFCPEPPQSGP